MRTALLVMLCVGLSAVCAHAADSPKAPELSALWSVKVSEPAGAPLLAPSGDRLAVLTWQGDVAVLDAHTGRRLWRKQPKIRGGVTAPGVAVDDERVIVAWPGETKLVAYALANGREAWSAPLGAVSSGVADCARHRAVVVTHRGLGTLVASAFDPEDGRLLWRSPVPGPLIGAGDAYVFTETPSNFGAWPGRLAAVHCATGEVTPLPTAGRELVRFLAAGSGFAVARHLDRGFNREVVCLHRLGAADDGASSICQPTGDDTAAAHALSGALVDGDTLYFSTAHMMAHNLDPSPDSWVFARTLSGEPRWRSPPLVSRGAPVAAGELLWTGFGSTGADDFAYLLDRADGRPVGRLPLRKAPTALAADRERAYVSTYDGRVYAVKLPRPGPERIARKPLTPTEVDANPAPKPSAWRRLAILDAHPRTARSSGSKRAGTADRLAFVDPAGAQLAIGGNDDKVRVFDLASRKQRWISKSLGKDVEALELGGERLQARIYGGISFVFERDGRRWRRVQRIQHRHGWMSGITGDGGTLVADDFDGTLTAYDAATGGKRWSQAVPTQFDARGMRVVGQRLVALQDEQLRVFEVGEAIIPVATRPTPRSDSVGPMTQAWMIDDIRGAWEYCGPAQCAVEIAPLIDPPKDAAPIRLVFDIRGAGWSATVPSNLEISPDGRWLFFFRLGLEPLVVEIATDRRIPLSHITEKPAGEYTTARFSADGRRLALGMHPASWQVTVIEQKE